MAETVQDAVDDLITASQTDGGQDTDTDDQDQDRDVPSGPGDMTITREEYAKFLKAQEQAKTLAEQARTLQENWQAAQAVIRREGDENTQRENINRLLKATGHTDAEISLYWQQQNAAGEDTVDDYDDNDDTQDDEPVTNKKIEVLERELKEARRRELVRELNGSVGRVLDSDETVTGFLAAAERIQGEKFDKGKIRATLQKRIDAKTRQRMQARYEQSGRWDDAWIQEEAARAAKDVIDDYSAVIGDLDQIGRSPETGAPSETSILSRKPVEPPKYEGVAHNSDTNAKARQYTEDALMRIAADASNGGGSKV